MNDQDKSREQLIAELAELRQRVAAGENGQKSRETATALLQVAPLGIHECDCQGRITFVNPSQEAITGYTADELLGSHVWDRVEPGPQKDALPDYFRRLVSEQPVPTPYFAKNVRKSGEVFDARIDWNYIRNVAGKVTGFVSIVSDVTQQRRAQTALQESERRLSTLLSNLPGMAYRCRDDSDRRMEFVSEGCLALTGYQASELIHDRAVAYGNIVHPADRHAVWGHVQQALAERRRFQLEYRIRTAQGDEKWVWEQGVGVFSSAGELEAIEGFIADITEGKRAATALRESERRLGTLLSNLPGAVYRCKADANWTVEFLSDGYLSLTGYEPSQLIGQPGTRHSEFIHPDDRQREFDAVQEAIAQKRQYQVEYRLRTATGQEKWVWEQGTGIFSDNGELEAIEGFTTDITDRKRAEEELQEINERLEELVAERTADLTQANERLQAEVRQRRAAEEKLAIFRRFVEAATQGFGMAGVDGRIIYANPFLARLLGAPSQEDAVGKHVAHYYPAAYREHRERVILPALRRKEPWQGEQMMVFADGKMHPTIHTVFPVLDDHGELFCTAAVITDITTLKEAEEALRQNEAKYRALVESSPVAVVMVDLQGRIVFASQRAAELHGVSHPERLVGCYATDSVAAPDRDRFRASIGRLIDEGVHRNIEYTLLRADGTTFAAEVSSAAIRDAAGKPEALMAVYRDITERKRDEEKLAIFERFVEAATQGFGMSDLEERITYANPMLARLLGEEKPEDAYGQNISTYHTSDYFRIRDEVLRPALRQTGYWHGELPLVRRDGTVLPTLRSIFPVRDKSGTIQHFAVVITDITELKQTQEMLRQTCEELRISEERFELVVRAAGAGVFDWDIRTGRVYYSPRWKELFGYEEHEIGEGFDDWASRLHPDERASIIKRQEDFLAGTSPTAVAEYRLRHKDGSYRWIIAHVLAVRDSEGKACRLVGSHVDITDRRLAEEKVLLEQRALRRMVLASDRERRLITYELHDGVAQQLLGAMLQFKSQEPRRGRNSKAAEAYREGIDGLHHAAAELRRVMNWLRTPVLDKFGLTEAIEDVAAQLRSTPGTPEIEYHHDVQFERLEPTLENSLFRIAQEAMTNACRHSQSEKVRVKLTQKGDEVTLEVRDWGIGFEQNTVQENRFGLEGIRERSRILGGKLSIKSEPGNGTVVRAVFPVMEATGQE